MQDILIKASSYIAIIILGYILRRTGFFGPEAFGVLSKLVIRLTMPCAIILGAAGRSIDLSMLTIVLLGFGGGVLYMLVGWLVHCRRDTETQAFAILNTPGYSIGAFSMPFTQSFFGPIGIITTSLFDMGNAFICLGGSYGIAASVKDGKGFDFRRVSKALLTSVPFVTHVTMITLNLCHLSLPAPVLSFVQIIANGNAFLAMLMVGVGFRFPSETGKAGAMLRILSVRYALAAVLALCFYYLLPFSQEVRQALVILVFSPVGSAVPIFTAELKGDVGLSSAINSISILISIVIIVTLLVIML